MPELPRLDYLIRLAVNRGYNSDWVFNGNLFYGRIDQAHKKVYSFLLPAVLPLFGKPPGTAGAKVSAWRVKNCQIKPFPL
jgi:hypothetical protein